MDTTPPVLSDPERKRILALMRWHHKEMRGILFTATLVDGSQHTGPFVKRVPGYVILGTTEVPTNAIEKLVSLQPLPDLLPAARPFHVGQRVRARMDAGTELEGVVTSISANGLARITVYWTVGKPQPIPFEGTYVTDVRPDQVLEQSINFVPVVVEMP